MSDLEIQISENKTRIPITVIQLDGRLNMGNSDQLLKVIEDSYHKGSKNIILDLRNLVSLTSAGLRVILSTYKLLGLESNKSEETPGNTIGPVGPEKSPHLKLVGPPPPVDEVLRIAGFDRLMEIYDDLDGALAAYQS
jgi:anti-anti-sigma factor